MKFRTFRGNKLWRDKIPAKMEAMGSIIHWQRLDDAAYEQQLRLKMLEEVQEVVAAQSHAELIEELADVFEVIDSLCGVHGITKEDVIAFQDRKRAERGGFAERKFVTIAEHPEGSWGEQYCLNQPDKYPEIK